MEDIQSLLNGDKEASRSFNFAEMQQALTKRVRQTISQQKDEDRDSSDEAESDID